MRSLNKANRLIILTTVVLTVAGLLLGSACAGAPKAEAQRTVKVGYLAHSTGPLADGGVPLASGAADYFRWVNDKGGVDGVMIDYKWIDTGYEVPRSIASYRRLKEWGAQVLIIVGTVINDACREMIRQDGMPVVAWGGDPATYWPPSNWFATYHAYTEGTRYGLIWAKKNLPGLPAKPKVGIVHSDDAFGWSAARGPLFYQDVDGYEVVADEILGHGALDATTQIRHIIDAKADILTLHYTVGTAAVVIRDAKRLGFKGHIVGTPLYFDLNIGPLSEGAVEGTYAANYAYPLAMQKPAMKPMIDMVKTYHPDWDSRYPYGGKMTWQQSPAAGLAIVESIRTAMKTYGYDKITPANLMKSLETLKNIDAYGLQTMSFSADDHRGSPYLAMFRFEKGEFKLVTDFERLPEPADWEKAGKFKWAK